MKVNNSWPRELLPVSKQVSCQKLWDQKTSREKPYAKHHYCTVVRVTEGFHSLVVVWIKQIVPGKFLRHGKNSYLQQLQFFGHGMGNLLAQTSPMDWKVLMLGYMLTEILLLF
jgi:hypothetical protein